MNAEPAGVSAWPLVGALAVVGAVAAVAALAALVAVGAAAAVAALASGVLLAALSLFLQAGPIGSVLIAVLGAIVLIFAIRVLPGRAGRLAWAARGTAPRRRASRSPRRGGSTGSGGAECDGGEAIDVRWAMADSELYRHAGVAPPRRRR
jgi:hypothetical protein